MKKVRIVSRIIIGLVFIFSGTVKAIDPLGFAYKFHDYFQAFNMGFLNSLSLILAIFFCTAEFIAGFAILTGIRLREGLLGVLILLAIFTPLTFILALTNPVSDCGCFGDAIHLTNWQTFGKNIILLFLFIALYTGRKQIKTLFSKTKEWLAISITALIFILFSLANLRYLPIIDFLPYKTGVKIADKMVVPAGTPVDKYKTTFVYEKNGIKKVFDLSNYPANDSGWKFIEQKSVLIKKGYKPPIHDFMILSPTGEDLTQQILSYGGYTVLMISKKLNEAGKRQMSEGFNLGKYCMANGISYYVLTSSGKDDIKNFENGLIFCSTDETTLKTMVRANPGYILLKDGIIIGKWSWANVPSENWFGNLLVANK
jgi:hypothetical protein